MKMNRYHVAYVELLIRELNPDNPQELKAQVREAQQEYDRIETYLQGRVMNLDRLEQMKKKLEDETDTPETNESETGTPETNESETEIEQEYTVTIKNGFINGTQAVTALFRPGDTSYGDGSIRRRTDLSELVCKTGYGSICRCKKRDDNFYNAGRGCADRGSIRG